MLPGTSAKIKKPASIYTTPDYIANFMSKIFCVRESACVHEYATGHAQLANTIHDVRAPVCSSGCLCRYTWKCTMPLGEFHQQMHLLT